MRRILIFLTTALLPLVATAQQPSADVEKQALGQMVIEAMQREAALRAQLITTNTEIDTLKKQTEAAKPKPSEP